MPHPIPFADLSLADRCGLILPMPFGDDPAAKTFLLLRYGDNPYTKGGRKGTFSFSREDAGSIVRTFDQRGHDLVCDYDHTTLNRPGEAPASGWITALTLGDDGLYATVTWTEKAASHLRAREYRYHSPVLHFDSKGHPCAIHSVALTNHPALDGYPALAANAPPKETIMNEHLKAIAEKLGIALVLSDGKEDEAKTAAAVLDRIAQLDAQDGRAKASGVFSNANTGSRSAALDATAAIETMKHVKGTNAGLTQGRDQSPSTATQSPTNTTHDDRPISVPVSVGK